MTYSIAYTLYKQHVRRRSQGAGGYGPSNFLRISSHFVL